MAFDALLRFRDARLEAAFWSTARGWLSTVDLLASVVVCIVFSALVSSCHLFGETLNAGYIVYTGILIFVQFCCAVMSRSEVYHRWRSVVMVTIRVSRYLLAAILSALMVPSAGACEDATDYLFRRYSVAFWVFVKAIAHRGFIFWAQYYSVVWPLPFSLHATLHTFFMLPVLLHAAFCLARDVLWHPQLQPLVCAIASYLSFGAHGHSACHPLAPQLVAFPVSIGPIIGRQAMGPRVLAGAGSLHATVSTAG